jgi:hypothetical protein
MDLALARSVIPDNVSVQQRMPREFNQNTLMLAELNKRLEAVPFVPFTIVTSSGKTYEVPTPDHLTITRLLREVLVEKDDGTAVTVNLLHVVAIERLEPVR